MNKVLQKIITGVLIATLGLAGLPLSGAYAAAPADAPTPVAPSADKLAARLQQAFARENTILGRIGKLYTGSDAGFTKLQNLLDKAKAHGLDVSQIQAALDAFKAALTNAKPFYTQALSTAQSHAGFDANGQVTDPQTARATVKSVRDSFVQYKGALNGTGKALHEAIQAFRQAHPRATPTPAASGSGSSG